MSIKYCGNLTPSILRGVSHGFLKGIPQLKNIFDSVDSYAASVLYVVAGYKINLVFRRDYSCYELCWIDALSQNQKGFLRPSNFLKSCLISAEYGIETVAFHANALISEKWGKKLNFQNIKDNIYSARVK